MKVDVTFRNMQHTPAIEEYVAKNVVKFEKYVGKYDPAATFVHVILDGHFKHHKYDAEVRVKTPAFNLVANREGADMYPLIDEVMHIMEKQLQNAKQELVDDLRKRKKISEE